MPIQAILLILLFPAIAWSQPSFEHTPGAVLHAEANSAYEAGNYGGALTRYRASARWADKLSQFNLGVMHYHGQGTQADIARAWAWFELAAERGYPQMVTMAERVRAELDEDGLARGQAILENELRPEFGDEVAIERTARHMARERRNVTGSRVGFVGNMHVYKGDGPPRIGDEFFADEHWDFRRLVEIEGVIFDRLHRGRVRIGEMELHDNGD